MWKSGITISFICFLFIAAECYGQNLVPNPSFENITSCPPGNSGIGQGFCIGWSNPPGAFVTPDLFHSCTPLSGGCFGCNVPNTFLGFSNAYEGTAFGGIMSYYTYGGGNLKEYVHAQLTSPLSPGLTYHVSMRVRLGPLARYATNRIGVYISAIAPNQAGNQPIPVVPQIEHPAVIGLSPNWTLVQGDFVAVGGEQFITIGCFYPDAQTTIVATGNPASPCLLVDGSGEYFVDSVFLGILSPSMNVQASNDTTICIGGSANLSAINGPPYSWYISGNPGAPFATTASVTVSPAVNTTYVVSNGSSTDTVRVFIINPPQSFNLGNDTVLCSGQTLLLNATQTGMNYLWQNGSVNSAYTVNSPGLYWVRVSNSCDTFVDSINITYLASPTINLGNDTMICTGNSITLNGTGANAISRIWSNGAITNTISVSASGQYWVELSNNCATVRDTINVIVVSPPVVILPPDDTLCGGQTLLLDISQNPAANYLWQDNSTFATFNVNAAGLYWGEATNLCGSDRDSIQITYIPLPSVFLGNDTTICSGTSILLDGTGQNALSRLWSTAAVSNTITISTAGTYWVQLNNNCGSARDTIIISILNPPQVSLPSDDTLCTGQSLTLNITQNPAAIYLWQDNSNSSTLNVNTTGLYWGQASNACGSSRDSVQYIFIAAPAVNLGPDISICAGTNAVLDGTGANASQWLWNNNSTSPIITVNAAGTYSVTVFNGCGNAGDEINVSLTQLPVVALGPDLDGCEGESFSLNATYPSATYLWEDGGTSPLRTLTQSGLYFVYVTTICGIASDSVSAILHPNPVIDLAPDSMICAGFSLELNAGSGFFAYTWSGPGVLAANDSVIPVSKEGTYSVEVTDNFGCKGREEFSLSIDPCAPALWVPSGFTPNGDGLNDSWLPVSKNLEIVETIIFDRWGKNIFMSTDPQPLWNGTFLATECPESVYAWTIDYVTLQGETGRQSGTVTLMR